MRHGSRKPGCAAPQPCMHLGQHDPLPCVGFIKLPGQCQARASARKRAGGRPPWGRPSDGPMASAQLSSVSRRSTHASGPWVLRRVCVGPRRHVKPSSASQGRNAEYRHAPGQQAVARPPGRGTDGRDFSSREGMAQCGLSSVAAKGAAASRKGSSGQASSQPRQHVCVCACARVCVESSLPCNRWAGGPVIMPSAAPLWYAEGRDRRGAVQAVAGAALRSRQRDRSLCNDDSQQGALRGAGAGRAPEPNCVHGY